MLKNKISNLLQTANKPKVALALAVFALLSIPIFPEFLPQSSSATPGVPTTASLAISPASPLTLTAVPNQVVYGSQNVSVTTTNHTGFTLTLATAGTSTNLVNSTENTIPTITLPSGSDYITTSEFSNLSTAGYAYSTNATQYKPVPALNTTDTLTTTSDSNEGDPVSTTLSFGVKTLSGTPAGTYSNTFTLTATTNPASFTVSYYANAGQDVVQELPNPNESTISGVQVTLSNKKPTRTGYFFTEWNTAADGSGVSYARGATFDIDPEIANSLTLYAQWTTTNFPYVFEQQGECEFHGDTNSNITGSQCQEYTNGKWIDTGVALYSTENYSKDFEIGFTIVSYSPSAQETTADGQQHTFVSSKLSTTATIGGQDAHAQGMVVRAKSGTSKNTLELSTKLDNADNPVVADLGLFADVQNVKITRVNGVLYYSVNGSAPTPSQDISSATQRFDLTTWFGAYPADDCTGRDETTGELITCTNGKRIITGTLSNMYIRLGTMDRYTVNFDPNDGAEVTQITDIMPGSTISTLPVPVRAGFVFDGWWTSATGGTQFTTSTPVTTNGVTYYAHWTEQTPEIICKIGTEQHVETCTRTSGSNNGCYGAGYATNEDIYYGSLFEENDTLTPGHAFTCDINGDAIFDEQDERFYYYGMNGTKLKLVYYKFISYANESYSTGLTRLPTSTTTGWTNPALTVYASGTYAGKVARYMTRDEAVAACDNSTSGLGLKSNNGRCLYLLEESNFANTDRQDGFWLGSTNNSRVHTASRGITSGSSNNGVRPVIEVEEENVSFVNETEYEITFDAHNETTPTTVTITPGDSLGSNYPATAPVYTNHLFQGWFTSATGGTQISSSTQPSQSTTYHAQWLKTVTLADLESNTLSVINGQTGTIVVNNASELEPYSFSSSDDTVATVTSAGVVTGESEGSATITMTGTTSDATKTIAVTVTPAPTSFTLTFNHENGTSDYTEVTVVAGNNIGSDLPSAPLYTHRVFQGWFTATTGGDEITASTTPNTNAQYHAQWKKDVTLAEITNSDLTFSVGDTITINVANSAELEAYTFSSANSNIASVNAQTGEVTGVAAGTTTITMTGTESSETKTLTVDVLPAPTITHTVTFNSQGGSTGTTTATVADNTALGTDYPSTDPTKTNYKFFGWYTDATYTKEVTPETVIDDDVTFYARWIEDTSNFPIVWSEINECIFNGSSAVTGTYCEKKVANKNYLNTAIELLNSTNYDKDFEVGFTITEFTPSTNTSQGTFVNAKWENQSMNYPGFVVRRYTTTDKIEITQRWTGDDGVSKSHDYDTVTHVRVSRRTITVNNQPVVMTYYSINGSTELTLQNITNITRTEHTIPVWFGASAQSNGTTPWRPLKGKLTDMYIRLGTYAERNEYTVTFDPNGGEVSETTRIITKGSDLGTNPPTPTRTGNWTFVGWFDENDQPVTSATIPDDDVTYTAEWSYNASETPVPFDVSNEATRDYQDLIASWSPSISTFTPSSDTSSVTAINAGSSWGIDETTFWAGMKSNFESNNCKIPSYEDSAIDTWNRNGTVDCSKPDAYDTGVGDAINVYVYDTVNQTTVGNPVTYAKAEEGIIHNMIPGKTYYWEVPSDNTIHGYVTATAGNNRRLLDTGEIRNTRDLGGLTATYTNSNNQTVSGTLKYERLFRGERIWEHTAPGNTTELTNLGINKQVDLRESGEGAGDNKLSDYVMKTTVHYKALYGTADYSQTRDAVTQVMSDITGIVNGVQTGNKKNVYFHCRIGSDRTGTLAYLLEGLLGVPNEERYEDYELSYLSGQNDRTRYYKEKPGNEYKFVYMMNFLPSNQSIIDWYMAGSQNTQQDEDLIQAFRNEMIE